MNGQDLTLRRNTPVLVKVFIYQLMHNRVALKEY
jgi:hypothetical protein